MADATVRGDASLSVGSPGALSIRGLVAFLSPVTCSISSGEWHEQCVATLLVSQTHSWIFTFLDWAIWLQFISPDVLKTNCRHSTSLQPQTLEHIDLPQHFIQHSHQVETVRHPDGTFVPVIYNAIESNIWATGTNGLQSLVGQYQGYPNTKACATTLSLDCQDTSVASVETQWPQLRLNLSFSTILLGTAFLVTVD